MKDLPAGDLTRPDSTPSRPSLDGPPYQPSSWEILLLQDSFSGCPRIVFEKPVRLSGPLWGESLAGGPARKLGDGVLRDGWSAIWMEPFDGSNTRTRLAITLVTLLNRDMGFEVQQDAPETGNSYRRVKAWKDANPEAVRAQKRRWHARNRTRRKEYLARYYRRKKAEKLAQEAV